VIKADKKLLKVLNECWTRLALWTDMAPGLLRELCKSPKRDGVWLAAVPACQREAVDGVDREIVQLVSIITGYAIPRLPYKVMHSDEAGVEPEKSFNVPFAARLTIRGYAAFYAFYRARFTDKVESVLGYIEMRKTLSADEYGILNKHSGLLLSEPALILTFPARCVNV
jgi:hypothetical protein